MLARFATGIPLAAATLAALFLAPPLAVAWGLVAIAGLCARELFAMASPEHRGDVWIGTLLVLAALAVGGPGGEARWALGFSVLLPPMVVLLLRPAAMADAARRLLTLWGGLAYVGVTFAFVIELSARPEHLLLALAVVLGGDTGAYLVGRALGRHKLYERVSPNKTVEGALGGLGTSVATACVIRWLLLPELGWPLCVALGLGGGILGQIGDLTESALKRAFGVKDSGRLLPGHGGALDRLDAFLFAAPFFALVLAAA